MPLRTHVVVGTGPGADVVVAGAGVAPQHAHILQRDGALYIQDLGQGQTSVDGRVLAQGETAAISGFHANVTVGSAQVALTDPAIGQLFVERSPLPRNSHVCLIGRDPARCHVIVAHPTVSGAHLTLDLAAGTITDTGSRSGTFDRSSRRLPVNIPEPLDVVAGYFVGSAWLATKLLLDVAAAPPAQGGAADAAAASNAHWQRPTEESRPQAPQGGPSGQFAMPTPQPQVQQHQAPSGFAGGVPPTGVQTPIQPPTPAPSAPGTPPAGGAPERAKHRTVFGSFDLSSLQGGGGKSVAVVGRSPEVDIVMPYPQLSSRHASIATTPDGSLLITDLGSLNGTYVQGQRIPRGVGIRVQAGERVFFGPYPTVVNIENGKITAYIESEQSEWSGNLVEIEALDLLLKVPDRDQRGRDKVLLNHVTFKCRPGDLIALMGPSGAGKTTLLTVLNGYVRPTSGEVRINGQNLYAVYDALRGNIGYVPQDDIVHPELTVWEAIEYSARFRLPPDFSDAEIKRRVEQTIKDLGLEGVKNLQIGKPERKVLSGGQRKRVNIALELVTDPALMFLDEPTSGLAADDTVALIDLLANLAKSTGKTIIVTIHQPAREEYEKFNLALVMGFGGEPVYFGPTGKESYEFFGRLSKQGTEAIDNPRDMFDLLRVREDEFVKSGQYPNKSAARLAAAQAWRAEYYHQDNPTYRRMYSGQRQPGTPGNSPPPPPRRAPKLRQFALLLRRYATVKVRDRVGTAILLAQAPIIGLLLAMVYAGMPETPHYWCKATLERIEMSAIQTLGGPMNPNGAAIAQCQQRHAQATPPGRFNTVSDYSGAIFFLVVAAIWFGTSNAAREIVSEQAIYRRERMVNLSIMNYLLSKFVLLSIFCVIQCLILLVIVYPIVGLGGGDYSGFPLMLGILILTSMSAVAVGLLLSTIVTSGEAAVALTPIVLIPQVVLGGRLVPMTSKSWLEPIMAIIPARWSFEGVIAIERTLVSDSWLITSCLQTGQSIENGRFDCAIEEIRNAEEALGGLGFETYHQPAVVLMVLISITVIMLIAVAVILRRRDAV